jgi:hypothetical protein
MECKVDSGRNVDSRWPAGPGCSPVRHLQLHPAVCQSNLKSTLNTRLTDGMARYKSAVEIAMMQAIKASFRESEWLTRIVLSSEYSRS